MIKEYRPRIVDSELDLKLESFGATLIVGPKGCGKTTTASQKAKSTIELQDVDKRKRYLEIASNRPSLLLKGEKPRLIDEWQDAPVLWDAVRKSVDDENKNGLYILTGSSSKRVKTAHTGTMRISTLKMYPMSLFESGESNGSVSLKSLFDKNDFEECVSNLSFEKLIFAICRGGWPRSLENETDRSKLEISKDLFHQTCNVDVNEIDGVKKNPMIAKNILKSYSRNVCTLASIKTIHDDVASNSDVSLITLNSYLDALRDLFIIEDVPAWTPAIRSKTAIRSSDKRNLVDPSIAVAALGLSPEYFETDFKTLGFLFESLCIRDLRAYSSKIGGYLSYYHDRYGLEADAVLHLEDGRYALIEIKFGASKINEGAEHLNKIEELIRTSNESKESLKMRLPDLKIVITGDEYGYRRKDGVYIIPIGCLRD